MRLVIALALLSCSLVAIRADDACGGSDIGNSGQFDFYVFQQSWPAEFCHSHSSYPGCANPTAWQQVNYTIHGLWPNYNQQQDGSWWPQCCQDSPDNLTLSTTVIQALLPELQLYWPNEEDVDGTQDGSLWYHEWQKHGTCSGLMQQPYMQAALTVGQSASIQTPSLITSAIGSTIQVADLYSYYGASNCGTGDCMVGIECSGGKYLSSITTCWTKSLTQMICPSAVVGSHQNCADTISITSFNSSSTFMSRY